MSDLPATNRTMLTEVKPEGVLELTDVVPEPEPAPHFTAQEARGTVQALLQPARGLQAERIAVHGAAQLEPVRLLDVGDAGNGQAAALAGR